MKPTKSPILLSPELIASSLDEYNGTFSPDGKEFFFTTNTPEKGIICQTRLDNNGKWTKAIIAPFSGEFSEYDPLFSPNGDKLYFSSERPLSETDTSGKTNIWYVEKQNSTWTKPKYLELEKQGVYYSSLTKKGDIYFNIWDTGDMYKAIDTGKGFKIEKLSDILNSKNGEGDPFISPEEDYIIFRGYNNSLGQGDLYISYKTGENWTEPENLGKPINSAAHEMCPYVTLDGKFFIFSSNRINRPYSFQANDDLEKVRDKHHTYDNGELNIYYISADFINEKRKKHE
jgi:Tol biopolymer transport system component